MEQCSLNDKAPAVCYEHVLYWYIYIRNGVLISYMSTSDKSYLAAASSCVGDRHVRRMMRRLGVWHISLIQ